jgi:hypothetical protein
MPMEQLRETVVLFCASQEISRFIFGRHSAVIGIVFLDFRFALFRAFFLGALALGAFIGAFFFALPALETVIRSSGHNFLPPNFGGKRIRPAP